MYDLNKMEIYARPKNLNRWDKDSIRPGPVGSVGDVNLQVKLKKSANYLPDRYLKAFSGKNEVWSGSNISDGQWFGYTSGGRGAVTLTQPLGRSETFKTNVGWVIENIIPVDRSRIVKTVPLGRYDWESKQAKIYRAKVSGDQFLPLPNGYAKPENVVPRGSQYPQIAAESTGTGIALPAADVQITDPIFGDTGTITVPVPGSNTCPEIKMDYTFTPELNDPLRSKPPPADYPYRKAWLDNNGQGRYDDKAWPDIGDNVLVVDIDHGYKRYNIRTSPCGGQFRKFAKDQPPMTLPKPGNQDKRRQDRKKEMKDEKRKKQKMR